MNYQLAWNETTKRVTIQAQGAAAPSGSTVIKTFAHDDANDTLGDNAGVPKRLDESHVFFQHVRDALYFEGEQNMQIVEVVNAVPAVAATAIAVAPTTVTLAPGKERLLTVNFTPAGATNKKVRWSSSNSLAATVSVQGLVTAVAVGKATITAVTEDGKYHAACVVTVANPV